MLDLDKLEAEREKASEDKPDLFEFYHKNWPAIIRELRDYARQDNDLHHAGIEHDLNTP